VELHEWLMFFHVLGAITWVGAVIVMNAILTKVLRRFLRGAQLHRLGLKEEVSHVHDATASR
jgi:uncharacterized membrane protein